MVTQKEEYWSESEESEEDEEGEGEGEEESKAAAAGKKAAQKAAKEKKPRSLYDSLKREPQFAGAEKSCLWELVELGRSILTPFCHNFDTDSCCFNAV